jgi:hypothetical protein
LDIAESLAAAHDFTSYAWFVHHLHEDMGYEVVPMSDAILASLSKIEIDVVEAMLADDQRTNNVLCSRRKSYRYCSLVRCPATSTG